MRVSPAFCRILDSFLSWLEFCFDDSADFGSGSGERGFISEMVWVNSKCEMGNAVG